MSRRFALLCALVLSSFTVSATREARAQGEVTVTILRRTALRTAPSPSASTVAFLAPSTFAVTQFRVTGDFVRLLLNEIDRKQPPKGVGYIAVADVDIDSGATTNAARPVPDTLAQARPAPAAPSRRETVAPPPAVAPARTSPSGHYALETLDGLRPQNVAVEPATHLGQRGVRVTVSDDAKRRMQAGEQVEQLAVIEGTDFANGVIEAEIAGAPGPNAGEGARGFVGIAFRVQPDLKTYDAFYLRPTNGRADDQERRNHSAQYISHPAWPWDRLRKETPGRYEAYVDLVPDAWTPIRIEVRGTRARLYVNGQAQPTLIVNDVKTGEQGRGAIALWIDPGTVAYFRNLRVTP
ncbi:MAG TPA: family 16 glycoside hydrolase [Gemmatimonadaceae bacterium]